jgi:DHA2 family multidrug resistance protein
MAQEHSKASAKDWIAVFGTMLGAFMAVLDIQITNSSLRDISGGIAATPDEGSWISTAYLIGEIITIPLTAWLSRVFTLRWYLIGNVILFLGCSAMCGISHTLGQMIIVRAGQGFTGGVFIPMALTVMLSKLPRNLHPVGQALFGMTATLAPSIGPAIGGWLTDRFGWEWNFYINFIPGAVMFITVWFAIDPEPFRLEELPRGDWWGILFMAVGLGSLVTMLEEGQRKDWFGNDLILTCGMLAAIFVPAFVLVEIFRERPFVNLRLLACRNLAIASIVGFALGLGLYGSVYVVPLYLGEVQGYSPLQIGEVLIWTGLPQLLIFPILPILIRRFDVRLLVSFGCVLFGFSCLMNSFMDFYYARDQLVFANIIRALGQPFTIVPILGLATATIAKKDAGDASAIFNILRNLGGSVGIAILSTVVTRREQFHDWRIGEDVTIYNLATQQRLNAMQQEFMAKGADSVTALHQALGALKAIVTREAFIMAFNDAFIIMTVAIVAGALLVWLCKRVNIGSGPAH